MAADEQLRVLEEAGFESSRILLLDSLPLRARERPARIAPVLSYARPSLFQGEKQMVSAQRADVPVAVQGDGVELRKKVIGGDMTVAFVRARKGTDLRPGLKGLPDDRCQCPHWGYVLSGSVRMHTAAGHQDYTAGQAFYWAPGHAPEFVEDAEYVDFSPTAAFDAVIQHLTGQSPG